MKFDYDNRNTNIMHQISHHKVNYDRHNGHYLFYNFYRLKKNHKTIVTLSMILIEILVIIMISGYYLSPLGKVSKVSVKGNQTVMSQSIVHDMNANPGDSVTRLLHYYTNFKKITFNDNPQLKSMRLRLHHWNYVTINVKEYPIIAYLNYGHRYYAVLNNGKRSRQYTRPNQVDPILINLKSGQTLDSFIKYYRKIPNSIKPDIDKIYYVPTNFDPNRVKVKMNDGNLVYANFKTWDGKMKYYSAISRSMKKKGVINIELGTYSKTFSRSIRK